MKTIIWNYCNTDVNILKIDNNVITGTFFKDKPEIGDNIICPVRKINVVIEEILENRDAKIHEGCKKNPELAWFKLKF